METKTKLLIAIGAAVVANCQPCLKTLLKTSKENKVDEKEILEAIGVAKLVRKNSITQIDKFLAGIA
jgi:AhpD family alkylhydroperoxidase